MTNIVTTIAKQDSCPDVVIENTTTFPAGTTHVRANFSHFVKAYLRLPNGETVSFSPSTYPNIVKPPKDSLKLTYHTCMVGIWNVIYKALPTPPDVYTIGMPNTYDTGDNFYYRGVIYNVKSGSADLPNNALSNEDTILALLGSGVLEEITESDIATKYIAELDFVHWCNLNKCLLDKISQVNCMIIKEPFRNDLCESELYKQVLYLNYISYSIEQTPRPNLKDATVVGVLTEYANYVNSICCCNNKTCKC
jgi:hypothetical protein